MTQWTMKETTFGELQIGASFQSEGGSMWFKERTNRAIGQKAHQGPKGRHWDYFKDDDPVIGEMPS